MLVLGIRKDCKFRTWKVFGVWQKRGARGRLEIPMDTEAKRKRRGKQVSASPAATRSCVNAVCVNDRPNGHGHGLCFSSRLARVVGTRGGLTQGEGSFTVHPVYPAPVNSDDAQARTGGYLHIPFLARSLADKFWASPRLHVLEEIESSTKQRGAHPRGARGSSLCALLRSGGATVGRSTLALSVALHKSTAKLWCVATKSSIKHTTTTATKKHSRKEEKKKSFFESGQEDRIHSRACNASSDAAVASALSTGRPLHPAISCGWRAIAPIPSCSRGQMHVCTDGTVSFTNAA